MNKDLIWKQKILPKQVARKKEKILKKVEIEEAQIRIHPTGNSGVIDYQSISHMMEIFRLILKSIT